MTSITFLELNDNDIIVHQATIEFIPIEPKEPPSSKLTGPNGVPIFAQGPAVTATLTPLGSYEVTKKGIVRLEEHPGMEKLMRREQELPSFVAHLNTDNINMLTYEKPIHITDFTGDNSVQILHMTIDPTLTDLTLEYLSDKYGLAVILTVLWMSYYPIYLRHGDGLDTLIAFDSIFLCEGYSTQRVLMDEWRKNPNMMTYDMMPVAHYRRMKVLNQVIGSVKMKADEFTFIFIKSEVDTHSPENRYMSTTVVTLNDRMTLQGMLQELKEYGQWTPMENSYQRVRKDKHDTLEILRYLK